MSPTNLTCRYADLMLDNCVMPFKETGALIPHLRTIVPLDVCMIKPMTVGEYEQIIIYPISRYLAKHPGSIFLQVKETMSIKEPITNKWQFSYVTICNDNDIVYIVSHYFYISGKSITYNNLRFPHVLSLDITNFHDFVECTATHFPSASREIVVALTKTFCMDIMYDTLQGCTNKTSPKKAPSGYCWEKLLQYPSNYLLTPEELVSHKRCQRTYDGAWSSLNDQSPRLMATYLSKVLAKNDDQGSRFYPKANNNGFKVVTTTTFAPHFYGLSLIE